MEQNGKNRKPYYKNKYAKKKPSDNTKQAGDAVKKNNSSYRSEKKNKPVKYSGTFDLADSFEAEEKKNADKNGADSRNNINVSEKKKSDNKYIPFESYDDDDIIPDIEDAFSTYMPEKKNGKKHYGDKNDNRRKGQHRDRNEDSRDGGIPGAVVGRNAVRELLRSDRSVDKLYVKSGAREGSIVVIVAEAVSKKIPIVEVTDSKLDSMAGGTHHQGVVALAAEKQYTDIESILNIAKERGESPLVLIADGIEDPQNLGAVIRCAECAGVHGIIIPKRRAVGLTPIVTKASAGAIEHMAIAKVANLADAIEKLKKAGLWIFAAEAGGTPYYEADFKGPCAIVLGSEGFGVSRLIKERSDFTVSIPMYGKVNSLNVSTAASVILCHAARMQRT